jgi:hypothetical protein
MMSERQSFANFIVSFFSELEFKGTLPEGISIMNPFRENPEIMPVITQFYNKFYNDSNPRQLIVGINPGRFGAGVTGIPFTDSKRLYEKCGFSIPGMKTFETSSVFIYEMMDAFGGVEKFYKRFFISAVCPLGFTAVNSKGNALNYNYYDSKKLTFAVMDFIIDSLKKQLDFGIDREVCYCLGTGTNYKFLLQLNSEHKFFNRIIPLEHPRYVMQYKTRQKELYINKYLQSFRISG